MIRWIYVTVALSGLACLVWLAIFIWPERLLLEQVPVHWDLHFQPDHSEPREQAVWYFLAYPGFLAMLVILTLVLPWLSPQQFRVDRFQHIFEYVMALAAVLFAYLFLVHVWAASFPQQSIGRLFIAGIFLFFACVGNVLGKVQRNFWMGVRTPWTLASEKVWIQTHRFTAWLWMAFGLAGFVAVLFNVPPLWCFGSLLLAAFLPVFYSLFLYKKLEKEGKV